MPAPAELTDLLRSVEGEERERAWGLLLERYNRLLLHVCRSLPGDPDAAMDRYAHVLEALRANDFQRLRGFRADGRGQFSTWLVVVARRLALDWARARYGRARSDDKAEVERRAERRRLADLTGEAVDPDELRSDARGPEARVRSIELHALLNGQLGTLGPRDRLLLRFRFEDDLSARRIAELMDFPSPFHVYRRIEKLKSQLRAGLEEDGVFESEP